MESAINISQQRERMDVCRAINSSSASVIRLFERGGERRDGWNSERIRTTWWWNNWPRDNASSSISISCTAPCVVIESWSLQPKKIPFRNYASLRPFTVFQLSIITDAEARRLLPRFFCPRIRNRQAEESASGETYVFPFSRTRTQTNRIVDKNKRDGIAINERERERADLWFLPYH